MLRTTLPASRTAGRAAGVWCAAPLPPRRRASLLARAGEPLGSQEKLQPFDEGAAQVARLLARDKRELLGDGADVADFVAASEFAEEGPSTSSPSAGVTTAATPAARPPPASPASPFGAPPPASPFGGIGFGTGAGAGQANPMAGLGADGSPLFTEAEDFSNPTGGLGGGGIGSSAAGPAPWYAGITLTQVVIALSFLLVILTMLATAAFVFKVGAIHFNE